VKSRFVPFLLLALALSARADDTQDLAAAANRFYATYAGLPRSGGIPSPAARARLAPLLSARLSGLIGKAAAADARFHAKVKDAPPLIEGDLFSSLFEGFQSYRIGACTASPAAGRCTVQLHFQDRSQKATDWNDEILFAKAQGQWKVDDIAYKGSFAFGNTGLLSQTLAMVINTAP
jgi:hypothetical protein